MARPSLLMLMAAASAAAVVANGVTAATPTEDTAGAPTRLGSAIAQDLSARDTAAARRKRALDLREQAAKATEARLQAQMRAQQEQQQQQAQAAAQPGGPNGAAPVEEQYDELARIYQAMKPAAAAVVFEQLEMDVQMKVASRMRDRSTAMILAQMTPKGAAALSMAMARKRAIGGPSAAPAAGAQRGPVTAKR